MGAISFTRDVWSPGWRRETRALYVDTTNFRARRNTLTRTPDGCRSLVAALCIPDSAVLCVCVCFFQDLERRGSFPGCMFARIHVVIPLRREYTRLLSWDCTHSSSHGLVCPHHKRWPCKDPTQR